jgi:hypothetical protein
MTEYCELLVNGAAKIARSGEALAFHPEISRDHTDFDLPELVRHFSLELFTIVSFISFLFYLAHRPFYCILA